jgi:hypothetical protein
MGELNEARLLAVQTLLRRAPDTALQSLASLLASDQSNDASIRLVRQLVSAETRDRRFRSLAFEPLAMLCTAPTSLPRLSFPPATPSLLWQAVKAYAPDLAAGLASAPEARADRRELLATMDEICAATAQALEARATPAFVEIAELLDQSPNGCARVVGLLNITPDLREALAKAPIWLSSPGPDQAAAVRIAFRTVSEKGAEAGFLYMETLFAAIEQPAFILKLVSMIMDKPSDRLLAASELSSIGERLLDAIDRHVAAIQTFDPQRGLEGGVAAAAAADAATLIISEFEMHLTMPREGVWGARIGRQRRALALAMETRLQELESAMAAALPVMTLRAHGKQLRGPPDLTKPPPAHATNKLLGLAALLDGCRSSAPVNGFGALRTRLIETLDKALETYIQEVLDLMSHGEAPVEIGRTYLDIAAEVLGLVRDPKAAELVRRRTVAAIAAAA